jgi:hypothetical protein
MAFDTKAAFIRGDGHIGRRMMRFAPIVLIAATSIVFAQQPDGPEPQAEPEVYDEEAWMPVSFEDREILFEQETRDAEWAQAMELAIEKRVAEFGRPLEEVVGAAACVLVTMCQEEMPTVILVSAECRSTLCKIEMHWPPGTFRGVVGQQISFLYGLGIDHQGEAYSDDDGSRYLVKLIARRRI